MKYFYIAIFSLAIVSCISKKEDAVKVTTVKTEILTDSVYSSLPGEFFLVKDFVVWRDVLGKKGFLHLLNKENGKEILKIGDIGQGPLEFTTPSISLCNGKDIYLYDLNTKKQAILDLSEQVKKIKFLKPFDNDGITEKLYIDSLCQISIVPNNFNFIKITQNRHDKHLKNNIVKEEIKNGYDVFQGKVAYNYKNKKMVYATHRFPYVAIYKKDNLGDFKLKHEIKKDAKYTVSQEQLKFNDNSNYGAFDMTLSKDYVVLLQFKKDNTKKRNNSIGRDVSKLPQTIFVYSYEGKLKKIIDLKMPILRIAGNPNTNELFFMGVNPEFAIYKCNL